MDWLDRIIDIVRRLQTWLRRLREYWFGYGNYTDPPWRWNRRRQRWELRDSETKSYHCTEYVCARIESRAPVWGGADGGIETHEVVAELERLRWGTEGCDCGCDEGESKNCVAVYFEDGAVIHAAIFDHEHCDWGGKLGAALPIARFRRAEDYYHPDAVPENAEIRIYCPQEGGTAPADGAQLTDEEMHRRGRSQ